MASPAFYYLFILDINFLLAKTPGINENETIGLSFNFADKILIISSIIMFQLTPFLLNKKFIIELFEYSKKIYISNNTCFSFKRNIFCVVVGISSFLDFVRLIYCHFEINTLYSFQENWN